MDRKDAAWLKLDGERKVLVIPASVSRIRPSDLIASDFSAVVLEPGNRHFCVREHLIMDFDGVSIVLHFGTEPRVEISDEIEAIGIDSFRGCDYVETLGFSEKPRLRLIRSTAFAWCSRLSVLHIPSSVQEIEDGVFAYCCALREINFEANSALRRIGEQAFLHCKGLRSFCVPSAVEFIGDSCFVDCFNLSRLTFESPSHLRELRSLPPALLVYVEIPESVEVLTASIDPQSPGLTVLVRQGSKLQQVSLSRSKNSWVEGQPVRAFVYVPAHRLKVLARSTEFPPSALEDEDWDSMYALRLSSIFMALSRVKVGE
jgi:hypothetical protein